MNKVFAGTILILIIVAGILVFSSMNPKISEINNPIINNANQTVENNTTSINNNVPSANIPFISFASVLYNPLNPSNKPNPSYDQIKNILDLFDAYVQSTFPETGIPGAAVVIVQNDEIIYMNCLGVRDIISKAPINKDTLFQIASCTKAFTSTNVAQLVDQGLLNWNDKITKYYSDPNKFKLYSDYVTNELTISDVLIQRVGLYPNSGDEFSFFNYTNYNNSLYKARYFKNISQFRSTFTYNGIMYSLAGECAAKANKTDWSDLIKKDLLEPLNMKNAVTTYTDFINAPNRIHTYITIDGILQERVPLDTPNLPAGIISSSISEIANWLKFQIRDDGTFQGKNIVSKENLDVTRTGQIYRDNTNTSMYGMGWIVSPNGNIDHSGSEYYANSVVSIIPSKKIGIAVFSNEGTYGTAFVNALAFKLGYLLNGDTITDPWPTFRESLMPKLPLPPVNGTPIASKNLSTYIGVYSHAIFGNITIKNKNNTLICYYGNDKQQFNLTHYNADVFMEKNYYQAFNFTNINNGKAGKLKTNFTDYSTPTFDQAVFNRTNKT